MLIAGVIGEVKPGPPRLRKSPLQVVRRMMSYVTKSPTKPMNPPVAAAPAAPLVPPATTGVGVAFVVAEATEAKPIKAAQANAAQRKRRIITPLCVSKICKPFVANKLR